VNNSPVKRYVRLAALAALLAAPVLAVPVWTAPAASAAPVTFARSCSLPWPPPGQPWRLWLPFWGHRTEALIGNLSPAPGSTVAPGATISFLIAGEKPFPTPLSGDAVVTVNGASVTATAGAEESGVPITYANPGDRGSRSTKYEVPFSFALPTDVSGSAHIRATARDGDGNAETVCWTLTVQTTALPSGAVGGIGVAAIGGLALMMVQLRRRRGAPPTRSP
jgi:hypothetical protein